MLLIVFSLKKYRLSGYQFIASSAIDFLDLLDTHFIILLLSYSRILYKYNFL